MSTEAAATNKSLAPGALASKARNMMRLSLRANDIDNPFGSKTAFESIKSPRNSTITSPFSVTASQIPPREIRYDPDRLV